MAHGLDDVARARLTLGPDHGRALVDAPQRLAEIAAAAHERDLERVLVDVIELVGGRQDFRLVDVVDADRLEYLRLDEVADARLGHDRDRDRVHDFRDQQRVAHARYATHGTDVGRDALKGHHGDRAGIFGDARVLGRDDVHDHAALEHLGEALLGRPGRLFFSHAWCFGTSRSWTDGRRVAPLRGLSHSTGWLSERGGADRFGAVRIGAVLAPVNDWSSIVAAARHADALGFDAGRLWDPHHSDRPDWGYVACWSAMAGLAAATQRVRLVQMV